MAGFDVQGALKAGYSPSEILQHLDSQGGTKFDIRGALTAGYSPQEVLTHIQGGDTSEDKSYLSTLKQGVANVAGGFGESKAQTVGGGEDLKGFAQKVAPGPNFVEPKVVDENGVHLSEVPRAVVESAPGAAASIVAAKLMPGPLWLKALAGAATYAGQTYGNKVLARARANDHAEPTTGDRVAAAAGEIPEMGLGAIGVSRFLPGAGSIGGAVGKAGVAAALKTLGKTALTEGLTSAGQNALSQTTNTLGTKQGLTVDPRDVEASGIVGGATGAAFGSGKFVHQVNDAIKYRSLGGDMAAPASSVANDIQQNAPGSLTPGFFKTKGKNAYAGVSRSEAINQAQLGAQIDALNKSGTLTPEAKVSLSRAQAGLPMNEKDFSAIAQGTQGAPNSDLVQFLARKAAVYPFLKRQGAYSNALQSFTGGPSGRLLTGVREHMGKTALAAALGAGEGAHLIAFSPEMLATMAAGGVGSRVLDTLTGNINPANRFVSKFANPAIQPPGINLPQQAQPQAPIPNNVGPWGQRPPGPSVPGVTQVPPQSANPVKEAADLMAARRANAALMSRQAMPLLSKLANSPALHLTAPVVAGAIGGHLMGPLGENLLSSITANGLERMRDHVNGSVGPAGIPTTPTGAQQITTVPKDVITRTKSLVSGLQRMQKVKQQTLGQNQADEVASGSPLIDRVGGPMAVANPFAGQRMGQMVSAAKALQTLQQDRGTLPGRVNGAAQTVTYKGNGETPHVGGTDQTYPPKNIAKTEGGVAVNGEPFPTSAFAHLPAQHAANAITDAAQNAGQLQFPRPYFYRKTLANIMGQRAAVAQIGNEVPGLPVAQIAGKLEGAKTQAQAKAYRQALKETYPQAAAAIDKHLSDATIKQLWQIPK
jgi:hypothetical protein